MPIPRYEDAAGDRGGFDVISGRVVGSLDGNEAAFGYGDTVMVPDDAEREGPPWTA